MEGAGLSPDFAWKVAPPSCEVLAFEEEEAVEPPAGAGASAGPSVPHPPSEADILMHGKRVHVHGELAKNEAHPPQHAPAGLNYAAVAKEEMDDVAVHPPPVKLMSGKATGVEQWDKVNSPKARHD